MQFYLSIFAFVACASGVISRKSWPKLMSGRFSFYFLFFFPLAMLHDMWDLSSLTRGRTHAPCSRSTEPEPLDHQGSPPFYFLLVVFQFQVLGLNLPFILSLFFLICCEIGVQLYSSAYGYPVGSTPFIEETIFSLLCVLGTLIED